MCILPIFYKCLQKQKTKNRKSPTLQTRARNRLWRHHQPAPRPSPAHHSRTSLNQTTWQRTASAAALQRNRRKHSHAHRTSRAAPLRTRARAQLATRPPHQARPPPNATNTANATNTPAQPRQLERPLERLNRLIANEPHTSKLKQLQATKRLQTAPKRR